MFKRSATSLITGSHFALPAACLCICIHLERLASFSQMSSFVAKRQRISMECIVCFGLPVLYTIIRKFYDGRMNEIDYTYVCPRSSRPTPPLRHIRGFWLSTCDFALDVVRLSGLDASASPGHRNHHICRQVHKLTVKIAREQMFRRRRWMAFRSPRRPICSRWWGVIYMLSHLQSIYSPHRNGRFGSPPFYGDDHFEDVVHTDAGAGPDTRDIKKPQ